MRNSVLIVLGICTTLCALSDQSVAANPDSPALTAADVLPGTTALYVESMRMKDVLDTVLEHPLRQKIESLPPVKEAMATGDLAKVRSAISVFEAGMGKRLPSVIETLTSEGIVVGLDAKTEGLVILSQSRDKATVEQFRDVVLSAIRAAQGGEVKSGEYRGIEAYALGPDFRMAIVQQWLVIVNKVDLGKTIIDAFLDGAPDALSQQAPYISALEGRENQSEAWAFANIEMIRDSGAAPELYSGESENILAELLFGGILSHLKHADYGSADIKIATDKLAIELSTPHANEWLFENRQYFFGVDSSGKAPEHLLVPNRLFSLSLHRSLSEMWLRSDELLTEKAADELAQADSQLTTFFSGRDFGEDILGAVTDSVQLIAAQQTFSADHPIPAIKLPSFALQFRMKNAEQTQPEMRRVFQNFIGFLSIIGAMQGQPQFDLGWEQIGDAQLVTASYLPDSDMMKSTSAPINFNFSPTVAFIDDRFIISSTTPLAKQLATPQEPAPNLNCNTAAELDTSVLETILDDNKEQLISQNMLEKGQSYEEAETEIKLLLELLRYVGNVSLDLDIRSDKLIADLEVEVRSSQ